MVILPHNRNCGGRCEESAWGEWGSALGCRVGQGCCGNRFGGCREMCWGVGKGKERCVGSGEVWESVWGEWGGVWESVWGEKVCWRVGKGCEERNGGGVGKYAGCGAPTHFPTSPPLPPSHPNTLSNTSLSYFFPHLPFLAPHPNTFSYYPHISPHLLKVWQSYHVTKLLWRSYHVAKLLATVRTVRRQLY